MSKRMLIYLLVYIFFGWQWQGSSADWEQEGAPCCGVKETGRLADLSKVSQNCASQHLSSCLGLVLFFQGASCKPLEKQIQSQASLTFLSLLQEFDDCGKNLSICLCQVWRWGGKLSITYPSCPTLFSNVNGIWSNIWWSGNQKLFSTTSNQPGVPIEWDAY